VGFDGGLDVFFFGDSVLFFGDTEFNLAFPLFLTGVYSASGASESPISFPMSETASLKSDSP
jgi:hypothetical protein